MPDRNHIGVGVNVLLEGMGAAVIGAKSLLPVFQGNARYGSFGDGELGVVLQISNTDLVQDGGTKGMDPAQRALREVVAQGVAETSITRDGAGTESIRLAIVVVLEVQAVARVPVVVQAQRRFVPIEQVALPQTTGLRLKGGNAVFPDRGITVCQCA